MKLHLVRDHALIEVQVETHNVGHSVAQHVSHFLKFELVGKTSGHECDVSFEEWQACKSSEDGNSMFPGKAYLEGEFTGISLKDAPDDQAVSFILVGCTVYGSSFEPTLHRTQNTYQGSIPGNLRKNGGDLDIKLAMAMWGDKAD